MNPPISVITCTHNPRQDYLDRVLAALQAQTLSAEQWEFILVDNASDRILAEEIDLSWHPHARHVREEKLGLTPARLRGIRETSGDILVFVDDDNVLDDDYLEVAFQISKNYSVIGAWGGQTRPEFEETPPEWTKPYWLMLAIREFDRDLWSNLPYHDGTAPCGAGLCVRRLVAEKYAELVNTDPIRAGMDRKGNQLTSAGDSDLAFTACDLNLGKGVFTSLKVTHLISPNRLKEEYLLKLMEGLFFSDTILQTFRGNSPGKTSLSKRMFQQYQRWRMEPRSRRFYDAKQKGIALAVKKISNWKLENISL